MWKVVAASVAGTSHQADGRPCQDAFRSLVVGDAVVLVCADGAGSASRSEAGSAAASETLADLMREAVEAGGTAAELCREQAVEWCTAAREALLKLADAEDLPLREFACTLLAVVVDDTGAGFLQIGDGAIVACVSDISGVVFWPQGGEFAGTTYFLTEERFAEQLEFISVSSPIEEVALLTDGLERLGLRFAERLPHRPFFEPMFSRLRASHRDGSEFTEPLIAFLSSERVNERTDDDKTLLLATRSPAAAP